MPVIRVSQHTYDTLKVLAEQEDRSMSNMLGVIIEAVNKTDVTISNTNITSVNIDPIVDETPDWGA